MLEDTIIARIIMALQILRNIITMSMDRVGTIMALRLRCRSTRNTDLAVLTTITIMPIITTTTITSLISISMKSTSIHKKVAVTFLSPSMSTSITMAAATPTPPTTTQNQPQSACLTKSVPTPQLLTNR